MDYDALRTEILDDPAGLGYASRVAAGDDAGIAALLNARTGRGPVPIEVLSAYCTAEGITGAIEAVAYEPTGAGITLQLKGLCRNVLTLVRDDYRLTTCDVDHPNFAAGCDGLVAAGLMTAGQKVAILALAENRRGRDEVLFGEVASADGAGPRYSTVRTSPRPTSHSL
jgi:hypothetical protein